MTPESPGDIFSTDDIGSDAESMAERRADSENKAAREQWNDTESNDLGILPGVGERADGKRGAGNGSSQQPRVSR